MRALAWAVLVTVAVAAAGWAGNAPQQQSLPYRWLFVFRDMSDPEEVDHMVARFPRAQQDGYNGVVFPYDLPAAKAREVREAAKAHGLDLFPIVMGLPHDQNYYEGLPVKDALFVARGGLAALSPDPAGPLLRGGDFENVTGDRFADWSTQENEGKSVFADHTVVHGGRTAVRMENMPAGHRVGNCRFANEVTLQPFRQYRLSVWVKTEALKAGEVKVYLSAPDSDQQISFGTFKVQPTQNWTHYDIVFNSLRYSQAVLRFGVWGGQRGRIWWDDLSLEEIGLVNLLRRPGCPVTVRGENGTVYEEGRDFEAIIDPDLHVWRPYHPGPAIRLMPKTRIAEGQRLRVSYYHSVITYGSKLSGCMSEPRIFADWRKEVQQVNELLHPRGFLMDHDEIRVANWCETCRRKGLTPGQLLAWNVKQAAQIIREVRPDAEIWVWNDMFDPMQNAVDNYFMCDGTMQGSWEGLDKDVGIVNWAGFLKGKDCPFFADRGLRQVLAGYYEDDADGAGIREWLTNTEGVKGIVGAMYTTWEDRYEDMDTWARATWGGGAASK